MSYKSTQRINRAYALEILLSEIPKLPNDVLGDLLDALANSRQSERVSQFDNFIVTEFSDNGER